MESAATANQISNRIFAVNKLKKKSCMPASMTTFPGFITQDESDTVGLSNIDKSAPFPAQGSETTGCLTPADRAGDKK